MPDNREFIAAVRKEWERFQRGESVNPGVVRVIVRGQGEFHLRTLKWRLENNEKLNVTFEEPRIPYRKNLKISADRQRFSHPN